MKKNLYASIFLLFLTISGAQTTVIGKWKTIDDDTGKAVSIIEVFEKSGKIYGRVHEILESKDKARLSISCR